MKHALLLLSLATLMQTNAQNEPAAPTKTAAPAESAAKNLTAPAADPLAAVPMDKVSYFIGRNIAQSMRAQGIKPVVDMLAAGLSDGIEGKDSKIPEPELQAAMGQFQAAMQEVAMRKNAEASAKSDGFLTENSKKKGVTTTASGLQYEVLVPTEGPKPAATDTVKVHYKGTLLNGEEFDSSYARKEPATFPLNQVIPGWTEGVQLMSKGSKFKFVIPGKLAYGERGSPPKIGPNETLVFEVELLEIVGK